MSFCFSSKYCCVIRIQAYQTLSISSRCWWAWAEITLTNAMHPYPIRNTIHLVMNDKGYTKVSDVLLDTWLADLSEAELKTLLTIIRQTVGWNKPRDRISHSQFLKKTGLSQRSISSSIESLSNRNFIKVTDERGQTLSANERRYRTEIYYQTSDFTNAKSTIIMAKYSNTQTQNLPLTIYNNHKQQETPIRSSSIKKQCDRERIECIRKRKQNLSCSCFRCS